MRHGACAQRTKRDVLFLLVLLLVSRGGSAWSDTADEAVYVMEEVVVTAQKVPEEAQVVPLTLQVLGGDLLRQTGARDLADLAIYSPGLVVGSSSPTQPTFAVRGMERGDFTIGTDPVVGLFQDGVPLGGSGGALLNLSDIARIEVVKGPQGALFGRNATAGAIHLIPNKPVAWTEGSLLLRYGNYNKRLVEAVVNAPVTDHLFFRADALINRRDGFYANRAGGPDLDTEANETARGALLFQPGKATELTFTADYDRTHQDAAPTVSLNPRLSVGRGDAFGAVGNDVVKSTETRNLSGYALNVSHRFSDALTLWSTTSYRSVATRNRQDSDGLADIAHYLDTDNHERDRQFYQELRLNGRQTWFSWFLGASHLADSARQTHRVTTTTDAINRFLGEELLPAGLYWQERLLNKAQSTGWSAYGDLTWHALERLDVTVGLRYSYDRKEFRWLEKPNSLGQPFDVIFPLGPNDLSVTRDNAWTNWSPRFTAGYRATDDLFTYFSAAKGYKAGGFGGLEVNSEYEPETMTSFELGVKAGWFDKRVHTNLALFDYRYRNRQSLDFVPPSTPPPEGLPDIPVFRTVTHDVTGRGLEWEISWLALSGFRLSFDGQYSEIRSDDGGALLAPPLQLVAGLDYTSPATAAGRLRLWLDYAFTRGARRVRFDENRQLANARVTWVMGAKLGEISFWVKNLTDEETVTSYISGWQEVLDTTFITRAAPRTLGLDYRYAF